MAETESHAPYIVLKPLITAFRGIIYTDIWARKKFKHVTDYFNYLNTWTQEYTIPSSSGGLAINVSGKYLFDNGTRTCLFIDLTSLTAAPSLGGSRSVSWSSPGSRQLPWYGITPYTPTQPEASLTKSCSGSGYAVDLQDQDSHFCALLSKTLNITVFDCNYSKVSLHVAR